MANELERLGNKKKEAYDVCEMKWAKQDLISEDREQKLREFKVRNLKKLKMANQKLEVLRAEYGALLKWAADSNDGLNDLPLFENN